MNYRITFAILTIVAVSAGCDRAPAPPQTLVVDPVPVARSLGRDERMQQQLNSALQQLNAQLQRHSSDLAAQVEQEKEKLGRNPDEERQNRFRELVAAASQNLQQTEILARQKAADYRQALLGEFNSELRSAAMAIARERGATSVLIVGPDMLWFDPAADITAEVIARLRAQAAVQSPAADALPEDTQRREIEKLEAVVESIENQQKQAPQDTPASDR